MGGLFRADSMAANCASANAAFSRLCGKQTQMWHVHQGLTQAHIAKAMQEHTLSRQLRSEQLVLNRLRFLRKCSGMSKGAENAL